MAEDRRARGAAGAVGRVRGRGRGESSAIREIGRVPRVALTRAEAASSLEPFHAATLYRRADGVWKAAGLEERLRLHQARHTYASFMIASGVNAKALVQYMGHSSIKLTFDLYGHLMPGSEREAAQLLDAYLERASSQVDRLP